jgi:hypothetical protein
MAFITSCSLTFHKQAGSFCCPCTIVYRCRARYSCLERSCGGSSSETWKIPLPHSWLQAHQPH